MIDEPTIDGWLKKHYPDIDLPLRAAAPRKRIDLREANAIATRIAIGFAAGIWAYNFFWWLTR
jgi:hypothetical protein